jgi:hypothetical protein
MNVDNGNKKYFEGLNMDLVIIQEKQWNLQKGKAKKYLVVGRLNDQSTFYIYMKMS